LPRKTRAFTVTSTLPLIGLQEGRPFSYVLLMFSLNCLPSTNTRGPVIQYFKAFAAKHSVSKSLDVTVAGRSVGRSEAGKSTGDVGGGWKGYLTQMARHRFVLYLSLPLSLSLSLCVCLSCSLN
jgi:hypothetical protein